MTLYPTEQWLEEDKQRLNENEQLDKAGAGWGVDFNGSMYFVITDIPLSETTLGELSDEAMEGLPERLQTQLADIPLDTATELIEPVRENPDIQFSVPPFRWSSPCKDGYRFTPSPPCSDRAG